MLPRINPTTTAAWQSLEQHAASIKQSRIAELFQDKDRFSKWSFTLGDILFDLSKNLVSDETKKQLLQLAAACRLQEAIQAMFGGAAINETEQRAVLHVALRDFSGEPVVLAGRNIMEDV